MYSLYKYGIYSRKFVCFFGTNSADLERFFSVSTGIFTNSPVQFVLEERSLAMAYS